jgi:hypothetical protein
VEKMKKEFIPKQYNTATDRTIETINSFINFYKTYDQENYSAISIEPNYYVLCNDSEIYLEYNYPSSRSTELICDARNCGLTYEEMKNKIINFLKTTPVPPDKPGY